MKYEFHVGDYVETKDGAKGYICDVKKDWWRCTNADDEYSAGYVYRIVRLGRGGIHECYNRIGAYDFTKQEKKTIKKLNLQGYLSTQAVASVVNELVDAVNKLTDKENNV